MLIVFVPRVIRGHYRRQDRIIKRTDRIPPVPLRVLYNYDRQNTCTSRSHKTKTYLVEPRGIKRQPEPLAFTVLSQFTSTVKGEITLQ